MISSMYTGHHFWYQSSHLILPNQSCHNVLTCFYHSYDDCQTRTSSDRKFSCPNRSNHFLEIKSLYAIPLLYCTDDFLDICGLKFQYRNYVITYISYCSCGGSQLFNCFNASNYFLSIVRAWNSSYRWHHSPKAEIESITRSRWWPYQTAAMNTCIYSAVPL